MSGAEESQKRSRQTKISGRFITRPVDFLIKHNVTPNKISYIGLILTSLSALLIAMGYMYSSIWLSWIVPFLFGLAGAFDLFDGEVARRTDKDSQAGAFLDSNLDRLSDAIIIFGLVYGGLVNYFLGYILLFLVIMISYIRSRAEIEGINMKGVGKMERAERILYLEFTIIIELILYYSSFLITGEAITIFIPIITSIPVTPFFLISIIVFTLALILTVVQRLSFTFKNLNNLNANGENA